MFPRLEPSKRDRLMNYDWLYNKHVTNQYSIQEIATELEVTYATVTKALRYHNINSPTQKQLRESSNLRKYGVKNVQSLAHIKQKANNTMISKYGGHIWSHASNMRHKRDQTCEHLYGNSNVGKTRRAIEKVKQTNYTKYNRDHINQSHISDETFDKLTSYDWLYDQYIVQGKTITQISQEIGVNDTTIGRHMKECGICIRPTFPHSYKSIAWLNSIIEQDGINIQHALQEGEYKIPGTRYKVDGYCAETNTVYEFYGDYWHGNPKVFNTSVYNESTNCTMGELYQKTIEREQKLTEMGYKIVSIWEYDYEKRLD